jgi:hypothetical protein
LWKIISELRKDFTLHEHDNNRNFTDLQVHLPKEYVRKIDYRDDMREIKVILEKIWNCVHTKQDRTGSHNHDGH